jgi:hypothetical protein
LTLGTNVPILFATTDKDTNMHWLKLDPAGSSMPEPKFRLEVQDHFLRLFWPHHDSFDWDVAAFYRSRDEQPIYYFSPGAADLLTRFDRYPYEPCDRPLSHAITLQVGSLLAVDTAWVELPDDTRPYPDVDQDLDDDETAYWQACLGQDGQRSLKDGQA